MTDQAKQKGDGAAKDVKGEGNYSATRRFDEAEQKFVHGHKDEISGKAREAEKALDGKEGGDLKRAADKAAAHARGR